MNVVQIASEAVPFAKTGGLADVAGALPRALGSSGIPDVADLALLSVLLEFGPADRAARTGRCMCRSVDEVVEGHILAAPLGGSESIAYLIDQPAYFDRDGLYQVTTATTTRTTPDRFIFFARAALEVIRQLGLRPDLLHCNDWQTGLIPVYLNELYRQYPRFQTLGTLLTIHNLAYQGLFDASELTLAGLDWRLFNWRELEYLRPRELPEGRGGLRGPLQYGQPDLRPGDPDPGIRLRPGRAASVAGVRPPGDRQRHRHHGLEPEDRRPSGGTVRPGRRAERQGRLQGAASGACWAFPNGPTCRSWPRLAGSIRKKVGI